MHRKLGILGAALVACAAFITPAAVADDAEPQPFVTEDLRVPMSDGVELLARVGGRGPSSTAGSRPGP